jgi:hypothetical protein
MGRRGWSAAALAALAVSLPLAAAGVAPVEQVVASRPAPGGAALENAAPTNELNADAPAPAASQPRATAPTVRSAAARRTDAPAPARQSAATVTGSVQDQTGGSLPGTQVALTGLQTGARLTVHTDAAGRFAFRDLQPGQYELVASLSGFATFRNIVTLSSDDAVQRTITLPLGSVHETITLLCAAPAAENRTRATNPDRSNLSAFLSEAARLPARLTRAIGASLFPVLSAQEPMRVIRVGGNIRAPKKIQDVKPICPAAVPAGETKVTLSGQIGADGFITGLTPAPPDTGIEPPPDLVQAALGAVAQWAFTPTLLNNEPVEVNITVDILFRKP